MKSTLHITEPPVLYKGRKAVAWYLSVIHRGKQSYFIATNKAELKKVWTSIKNECAGFASLDWVWIENRKVKKDEITNSNAIDSHFSDPQQLLDWSPI